MQAPSPNQYSSIKLNFGHKHEGTNPLDIVLDVLFFSSEVPLLPCSKTIPRLISWKSPN